MPTRVALTSPKRLIVDDRMLRDVERTLRERRAMAELTPERVAELAAITDVDVEAAVRYWERANASHASRLILRATGEGSDAS